MFNRLFLFMILAFTSSIAFAQEYRYEYHDSLSTETISFDLKGNKIIDGEWEHVSNNPNTSGEVYSFSGRRSGNKLMVTFSSFIPYTLYIDTKKAEWLINAKRLQLTMKGKNIATKKMETSVIVFRRTIA